MLYINKIVKLTFLLFSVFSMAQVPPGYKGDATEEIPSGRYDTDVEVPDIRERTGYRIFGTKGKWGIKTKSDSIVLPVIYDRIYSHGSSYILEKDSKFGLMGKGGTIKLSVKYDSIAKQPENKETLLVRKNNKWGVMDIEGKKILPFKYYKIIYSNKDNGLSLIKRKKEDNPVLYKNGKKYKKKPEHITIYNEASILSVNGKHGMISATEELLPFEYDSIYNSNKRSAWKKNRTNLYTILYENIGDVILMKNGKYGIASNEGQILVQPIYDTIMYDRARNLYKLVKNGKEGAYIRANDIKTDIIYDRMYTDGATFITLMKDNKKSIIDYKGNVIIPLKYDDATVMAYNKGFRILNNGKKGITDINGTIIVPVKYDDINNFTYKSQELFIVTRDGKKGLINNKNKVVIPIEFDYLYEYDDYLVIKKDDKYGLYAPDGTLVAKPQYDFIKRSATEYTKLYITKNNNLYGIIGAKKNIIYSPQFTQINYLHDNQMLLNPFNNGKAYRMVTNTDGKTGLFEEFSSTLAVPVLYDAIHQKLEVGTATYFIAEKNNKLGVIDGLNKTIIPFEYNYISFTNSYYSGDIDKINIVAAKNNKFGVINLANEVIVPFKYKNLEKLSHQDLYKAREKENYVLINAANTILNKGPFDEIAQFENGEALTFYKGEMRVINENGTLITNPVAMQSHNGYKTFDEMKAALINALNSDDKGVLKDFANKAAPSEHILYFFKNNMFNHKPLENTNSTYIKNKYYQDLYKFKIQEWDTGYYDKESLTDVNDYTLYNKSYGIVTNKRTTDWAYGDTRFMEKILRNAIKINGYWISTYFMTRKFNR